MDSKQTKILVVDSRKKVLQKLLNFLVGAGYHSILCALDTQNCVVLAKNEKPSLIVMGWEPDGHNAIATMEEIKKEKNIRETPVMIFTGSMKEKPHLKKALKTRVVQFVSEPFDKHEFLLRVDTLVRMSKSVGTRKVEHKIQRLKKQNKQLREDKEMLDREVRLHLSTKEIAHITFKPVNTIKAACKRIRKKLEIKHSKQSLVNFLSVY